MADQRRYDDGTRPVPAYRDVPPSGLISPTAGADATAPGPVAAGPFADSLGAATALGAPPPAGTALPGSETALEFGRFPDSTRVSSPDLAGPPPPPPPPPPPRPAPRPAATPAPSEPPVRRAPVEVEPQRRPAAAAAAVEPVEPVSPIQEGDQVHLDPLLYRRVRPRADQRQSGPPTGAPWAPPRGTVPWTPPARPGSPRGVPRLGEPGSGPGPVRPRPRQPAPDQRAPGQRGPGRQPARRGARPWWLLIVAAILIFNLARGCGHI